MTQTPDDSEKPKHTPGTALAVSPPAGTALTTTQSGNEVGGHMGGRDVHVYNGPVINNAAPLPSTSAAVIAPQQSGTPNPFRKLFLKLESEAAEDKVLTSYIRQLAVYTRRVDNEEVIGLEQKLRLAGRDRQLTIGSALKENVYAAIKANIFSPTYQMIVATLMSKVHERFDAEIRPAIKNGADNETIDKLVSQLITIPISSELDECPQFDDVSLDYVRGMLFFLTGNCHIRWD